MYHCKIIEKNYRDYDHRVFVNRNVYLYHIKCYGFDMDYTLAEYISPQLDDLIFYFAKENLIQLGYPTEIRDIPYDPKFASRGVIFDSYYGNILKIDPYGMILLALHGFKFIKRAEIIKLYPSRFVEISNTKRYVIFNTLFDVPMIYLLSAIISYFETNENWSKVENGVQCGRTKISYNTIQSDVFYAVDKSHKNDTLKKCIIEDLNRYIKKRIELPFLLYRLKQSGKKTFIVTNSEYWYTNRVMSYLFDWPLDQLEPGMTTDWRHYFDIIIVDAQKPLFFEKGTTLKQVDIETGKSYIGTYVGPLNKGEVYQGGNSTIVSEMLHTNGKDIIYIGDHIFGDILKSKKQQGWRTFLVVPELRNEIEVWRTRKENFDAVQNLEAEMAEMFIKADSNTNVKVDVSQISRQIKDAVIKLETCYGTLGSLMRCGSHLTFFASQVSRFADLYSYSCYNLIYYPFDYFYRTPLSLMPHESTVKQVKPTDAISQSHCLVDDINNTIIAEEECELADHDKN